MKRLSYIVLVALFVGFAVPAAADTIYVTRAAWQAAVGGPGATATFEGVAGDGLYVDLSGTNSYVDPATGITFAAPPYDTTGLAMFVLGTNFPNVYPGDTSVLSVQVDIFNFGFPSPLTPVLSMQFPFAVNAVAFNFGGYDFPGTVGMQLSNGTAFNLGVAPNVADSATTLAFFGITTNLPFTSLDLFFMPPQGGDEFVGLLNVDNVEMTVPEPATLTLLGIGLVGLAARRRKKA